MALTLHGLGGFPSEHYLCLHMLGMHGTVYANYAINEADLLLAFGVRFDDRVTGKVSEFAKHGKIVHIDIDPSEINKNKVGARADRRRRRRMRCDDLVQLLDEEPTPSCRAASRYADWIRQIERLARDRAAALSATATTPSCRSTPSSGCGRSSRDRGQLDDTIVTTGVGQHQMWAAQYFHFNKPRHLVHQRRPGLDGLRPARGAWARRRPIRSRPSSTSTATAAS